jgi:hypothetical protein
VPAVILKLPVPVYGRIPPVADTNTCPNPPLQRIGAVRIEFAMSNVG